MNQRQLELFATVAQSAAGFTPKLVDELDDLYPGWRADLRALLIELQQGDDDEIAALASEALEEFEAWRKGVGAKSIGGWTAAVVMNDGLDAETITWLDAEFANWRADLRTVCKEFVDCDDDELSRLSRETLQALDALEAADE